MTILYKQANKNSTIHLAKQLDLKYIIVYNQNIFNNINVDLRLKKNFLLVLLHNKYYWIPAWISNKCRNKLVFFHKQVFYSS